MIGIYGTLDKNRLSNYRVCL